MQDAFDGVLDKRTMRDFDERCLDESQPSLPRDHKLARTRGSARVSCTAPQLAVKLVGDWERGQKKPSGSIAPAIGAREGKGPRPIA